MKKELRGGIERIVTTVIIIGLVVTAVAFAIINMSQGGTNLVSGVVSTLPGGSPQMRITN